MRTLAVLLPAYNEAENIARVVRDVAAQHIAGVSIEVLVVDDGSRDDTARLAAGAGARVISHPQNRGVGAAFRTGVDAAREAGVDFLLHMDSDGQILARDVPRVAEPVLAGRADLAMGSRFMRGEAPPANLEAWKGAALHLTARGLGLLTGSHLTDLSCGIRCMNRRVLEVLAPSFDYDYIQETLLQALAAGATVEDVPVAPLYEVEPARAAMSSRVFRYGTRFLGMTAYGLFHFYRARARQRLGWSPS